MKKKIELLSPAGSLEKLKVAFMYGADACYIGGTSYSLRANATNFSIDEIKEACLYAHDLGKKVYVTVNIIFHDSDIDGLLDYLKKLASIGVDAIIVSDPLIIDLVNDNNIDLKIHISTQASNLNYESVLFWKSKNVERVVLARELHKDEIREIIENTGIEVETFIHGAMCSSYSGRCVLSNYFTNRDANRGGCAQICRWNFDLVNSKKEKVTDTNDFSLAVKDLSLMQCLEEVIDLGITSVKIEGRMRSNYYIASVVSTYREAIDRYYDNTLTEDKKTKFLKVLNRVANRDSKEQFFNTFPRSDGNYYIGRDEVSNQDYLGLVIGYDENTKLATISSRNYFKVGDVVEFFGPNIDTFSYKIDKIYDSDDNEILVCNHPMSIIKLEVSNKLYENDIMRINL